MKLQKLWFFICLVFAFLSLETLVEESHEVVYEKSNETEPVQFLACVKLTELHPNNTQIDLQQLRNHLYDHLNSFDDTIGGFGDRIGFEELILNRKRSEDYLVLNGRACLIAKNESELNTIGSFSSNRAEHFAINRDTFDLIKMPKHFDHIDQLVVLRKGHPYSICSQSNGRFHCLHECFKRKARLARYFYEGNETGLIQLNSDKNQSIGENERSCFRKCKRENCKLVQLITGSDHTKFKPETFEARPKLRAFDYWVQLIGLVSSFAGLSLNEFASVAIEFAQSKVKKRNVRIALFCLKLAILLLALASFGYLCVWITNDYKAEEKIPKEKEGTRHLVQPKTFQLAICVYSRSYVNGSFEDKTMWEIERATDSALNDTLEGIFLDYQGRSFQTDYQVHPKKLFKRSHRCFPLSIRPNYQMISSNPKLTIKFNKSISIYIHLYLLSEDESLNGNSFEYFDDSATQKRIVERSSRKCIDYRLTNCTGRQNCVERCISRKFIETYNRTTFGSHQHPQVVDRDWFSSSEWSTLHPIQISYENATIYSNIRETCLEEFPNERECEETEFVTTAENKRRDDQTEEIDLQLEIVHSVEEAPSSYKLSLDIASIQTILFGLTALSILRMAYNFIQSAFRVRENKLVLFLIYLLCSFGASWHTYHILHLIVNGELVPTRYYELAKRVQMPVMVFCLQIDQKLIDRNHQLTGNYLEELTSKMSADRLFANVTYLNESNEWIAFDLSRVARFFLFNMKCFRMGIDQSYEADQFHFSTDTQVLKVNLKKNENGLVQFMTKVKETAKFSKVSYLRISGNSRSVSWYSRFSITHQTSLYQYADRFSFIRRHFSSFQEEEGGNLPEQLLELQSNDHHLRTLNLPLEEEAFNMEVEEDLFEQFYSTLKRNNRNKKTDSNQQTIVYNHLKTDEYSEAGPNFTFNLLFIRKVVFSTNASSFGMLILSLLNVLFIWFDLGVLDLHPVLFDLPQLVFKKIIKFLISSYQWLKKVESPLHELLKPKETRISTS